MDTLRLTPQLLQISFFSRGRNSHKGGSCSSRVKTGWSLRNGAACASGLVGAAVADAAAVTRFRNGF